MASLSRPVPFRNHSATKSAAPQKSSSQCRKLYTANAFRVERFSNRKTRQLQVYGSSRVEEATSSGEGGDSIVGAVEEDDLIGRLSAAVERRVASGLLTRCATESTTAFRLLHGATEGAPGFTVDVYGERVLVQCWRDGLGELEQAAVTDACRRLLPAVADVQFHLRGRAAKKTGRTTTGEENVRPSLYDICALGYPYAGRWLNIFFLLFEMSVIATISSINYIVWTCKNNHHQLSCRRLISTTPRKTCRTGLPSRSWD
jgi:hypothetical protein